MAMCLCTVGAAMTRKQDIIMTGGTVASLIVGGAGVMVGQKAVGQSDVYLTHGAGSFPWGDSRDEADSCQASAHTTPGWS